MSTITYSPDETLREIRELPETTEPKTRQQVLLEAAALIAEHGLARATLCDDNGRFCIAGAVGYAATGDAEWTSITATERFCGASYDAIYYASDSFHYPRLHPPPERWWWQRRHVTPEMRAVRLLHYMADGLTFDEAAQRS